MWNQSSNTCLLFIFQFEFAICALNFVFVITKTSRRSAVSGFFIIARRCFSSPSLTYSSEINLSHWILTVSCEFFFPLSPYLHENKGKPSSTDYVEVSLSIHEKQAGKMFTSQAASTLIILIFIVSIWQNGDREKHNTQTCSV